jgi:hydroxymethylbilane synthase
VSVRELVVGTRGSALALAQTEIVCAGLRRIDPSIAIRVERITTAGDSRSNVPLALLGRGVFVTEIESALRAGRIDFAVHSAKDLPSTLASDLTLGAILPRADARDVVVSPHGTLRKLPVGARVGTSSPRRTCQLRALRPDLELADVRGNVDTRLRKLAAGEFDALVLAGAGLIRLGRAAEASDWLDPNIMIPSVGQGALAVEVRADDERTLRLIQALDNSETRAAVTAERAFLAELGAGCRAAAGAYARVEGDRLRIVALIGSIDGRHVRAARTGVIKQPEELGASIARELLRSGGAEFLAHRGGALAGKRVAVTRAPEQSRELIELLRANGAEPVSCPTIAIERLADYTELDAELRRLASVHWIVFTSVNAVHAVADRLIALQLSVPASVLIAAVGGSTAEALARRIRAATFIPTCAKGDTLADELPDVKGHTVLFPRGDLAADLLPSRLRARGARVWDVVAYRTMPGAGIAELESRMRDGQIDAVIFMSPSSVRFAADILGARATSSERPVIACVGSTTADAVREIGLEPDAVPATPSVGAIVEALERCFAARDRPAALSST